MINLLGRGRVGAVEIASRENQWAGRHKMSL